MLSVPYTFSSAGFTKRQPMVVSSSCCARPYARSALPITNGARVIDSTPPAIARPISPALIARAAWPTASRPEAHRRLIVTPRSEEHTSELQSLMRISYAVFCLKKKNKHHPYTKLNDEHRNHTI